VLSKSELTRVVEELSRIRQEKGGAGISAPQIGLLLRIINFVYKGREVTVVNPVIKHRKGAVLVDEGCLSIPDFIYSVKRPASLTVFGEDVHGKPVKYKCDIQHAHTVEHEVDHLDGILIDKRGKVVGIKNEDEKGKLAWS
jgi:peptide deformylase